MLVKNIIVDHVYLENFGRTEYNSQTEVDIPYLAGSFKNMIPKELQPIGRAELINRKYINDSFLFNETINIGPKGLYYILLQKGYKIEQLLFTPNELNIDLYVNKDGRLIYSFYNPSLKRNINIRGKVTIDYDDIAKRIKTNLDDILLRNYFLQIALESFGKEFVIPEYFPEVMRAEQAANYINVSVKTIRTWTSEKKLKPIKIGNTVRFSKKELNKFLDRHQIK